MIRKVMGRRRLKPKQPLMISKVRQERMIWSTDVAGLDKYQNIDFWIINTSIELFIVIVLPLYCFN